MDDVPKSGVEKPDVACNLTAQGVDPGSCLVKSHNGRSRACQATLRHIQGTLERLIHAVHLSRPENYLSIYQSGCNMTCKKCHSWEFSQQAAGTWMSPDDIVEQAVQYEKLVTLWEPRERATAWHAHESCRCCGACVVYGNRSEGCPEVVEREKVLLSPQGYGPARNIVGFTGGDLTCRPEFYSLCARGIKDRTRLWLLIETNGYGLTPYNLDLLQESGVDAFWLDIKAFDPEHHTWLTGCDNERILRLPAEMLSRGFVLEVLSLLIPGVVEAEELGDIAGLLAGVDPSIPFTILACFPEYRMRDARPPRVEEIVQAYESAKQRGLKNIRLGNLGVFVKSQGDLETLKAGVDPDAF